MPRERARSQGGARTLEEKPTVSVSRMRAHFLLASVAVADASFDSESENNIDRLMHPIFARLSLGRNA